MDTPVVINEDDVLSCPKCKGDNLHHKKVEVYMRDDEDQPGTLTICDPVDKSVVVKRFAELTATRRDMILINFECEDCHMEPSQSEGTSSAKAAAAPMGLEITQHKVCHELKR